MCPGLKHYISYYPYLIDWLDPPNGLLNVVSQKVVVLNHDFVSPMRNIDNRCCLSWLKCGHSHGDTEHPELIRSVGNNSYVQPSLLLMYLQFIVIDVVGGHWFSLIDILWEVNIVIIVGLRYCVALNHTCTSPCPMNYCYKFDSVERKILICNVLPVYG